MAKSPAQRKEDERKRKKEHLAAVGAQSLSMIIYGGTRSIMDQLKQAHDFEEGKAGDEEMITYLLHNTANCDMSQQKSLLAIPQQKTA